MTRIVLAGAMAFVGILGFLTVTVIIDSGPDILSFTSLVVLALLGFGIASALRGPEE